MELKNKPFEIRVMQLRMIVANMDDVFTREERTELDEIIEKAERRFENEQRKTSISEQGK